MNQIIFRHFCYIWMYTDAIIDGAEEWVKAINNSSKVKLEIPVFPNRNRLIMNAKKLKLYDIFGVDRANRVIFGKMTLYYYYATLYYCRMLQTQKMEIVGSEMRK